jgi:predicted TIM-barrel fold metal-dependent hydrolase
VDDDNVIIVSGDSHAGVPKDLWTEYLPQEYHALLPQLRKDTDVYPMAISLLGAKRRPDDLDEHAIAHREEWHGLYDPVLRIADMDREGIAAELIYLGDFRLGDMFHNVTGRDFGLDAWEAGAKGWNRWAADAFGFATDRFLVTGAIGPCVDMDAAVAEVHWIADHAFTSIYAPGYMRHAEMPSLHDAFWEPLWTACEERGIVLVVHAGYGTEVGHAFPQVERIYNDVLAASGSEDPEVMLEHAEAVSEESIQFFFEFSNKNLESRRPMWQLMLGGVFDRHPDLRVMLSEIRIDWIPATLAYLDGAYEQHRDAVPAKRKPSEYWPTNFLAGASFIHKAEVGLRHELGVDTILFGRDYPHPEGTWPHTAEWLRDAFSGVPEDELRLMLGENAIRFFDLNRERLAALAKRIGPTMEQLIGPAELRPELLESFASRGGYLKPIEADERIALVDGLVVEDIASMAGVISLR